MGNVKWVIQHEQEFINPDTAIRVLKALKKSAPKTAKKFKLTFLPQETFVWRSWVPGWLKQILATES